MRIYWLLPFYLMSFFAHGQDIIKDSVVLNGNHQYSKDIFTINPVRSFVDEASVNWELIREDGNGHGFSLGYIFPNTIFKDLVYILEESENLEIRANSYGAVARYFWVIDKKRRILQPTFQLRYYQTPKGGYNAVVGNQLPSSAIDLVLDRQTLVYGVQLICVKKHVFANSMVILFYAGGGINLFHNIYTKYHDYIDADILTPVPERYKLPSDGKIKPGISMNMGVRIGFAVKR